MNREAVTDARFVSILEPETQDATVTSTHADLQGADAAEVIVHYGDVTAAAGAHRFNLKLQHSDTTTGGDFVDVPDGLLRGEFDVLENGVTEGVMAVGYVGNKRYLRLVATETGTAEAVFGAFVRKSYLAAG